MQSSPCIVLCGDFTLNFLDSSACNVTEGKLGLGIAEYDLYL